MRTSLSIEDALLDTAQQHARERGLTLGQLVEQALRAELAHAPRTDRLEIPVFDGGDGVRPGIDATSNRAMRDAMAARAE